MNRRSGKRGQEPVLLTFSRCARSGVSLIELLVVLTIIMILMALYLGVLSRALSKAKQVAAAEGLRQHGLGQLADNANIARPQKIVFPTREECRRAYRQVFQGGKNELIVTELLYRVVNEKQFEAYWYTLIDPEATGPLEFDGSQLVARDAAGNVYYLPLLPTLADSTSAPIPVAWEFLSTNPRYMSSESLGINVLYSDGHVAFVPYPHGYPACRTVAELSQRFVEDS